MQKSNKPRFSIEARNDITSAASFIAADNPREAEQWRDQVFQSCHLLAHSPLIGLDRSELGKALRSFPVGRFIILYQPRQTGVHVVRVVHGAMDIEKIFQA